MLNFSQKLTSLKNVAYRLFLIEQTECWLLFHLIWKNYVLYWDFDSKNWIMAFFTRFTREKWPQNNFSGQNFSIENNYLPCNELLYNRAPKKKRVVRYNEILFLRGNFSPLITGSISKSWKLCQGRIFLKTILCVFLCSLLLPICIFWPQLFTSMKANLQQDINGGFAFSRCLNGTFPWRKCSIKALAS